MDEWHLLHLQKPKTNQRMKTMLFAALTVFFAVNVTAQEDTDTLPSDWKLKYYNDF